VTSSSQTSQSETGLRADEVRDRVARGLVNDVPDRPSRTLGQIARANVLTRFNAILGVLLVVILVVGPLQDALFGLVLLSNTAVGIVQEWRAKRSLDRLALLTAPVARVVRDGAAREVAVNEVVLDDVLEVGPGDQVVVDGVVLVTTGLEVDESLLSGESEPADKAPGDEVLSGSFVAAGTGLFRATRVGREAYAKALIEEAQRFTLVRSDLRAGIDRILRAVTWVMAPVAALLIFSQLVRNETVADAVRGSVAGVGSMVPEGLVLLTSVAFAVGVVRLGRRRVLVQELPAIESLARVDVVCVDKTGTLTEGEMVVADVEAVADDLPVEEALGAIAAADAHPNPSLRAVAAGVPRPDGWAVADSVAFSSARKWSAFAFVDHGAWVLGAPDVVLDGARADVARRAEHHADSGRRVLLLASSASGLRGEHLPVGLEPAALVVLEERIRPDAAATLRYFADQEVAVKVMSGDHPRTVAAVAERLGLAGAAGAVDARTLPEDGEALAEVAEGASVFGRVTPQQKRAMVAALQSRGHVVAMTGDGVNDVLALKDADVGVAMGSGSAAARGVARLVLLDNTFDVLPTVVSEGRRVIANIERVANLFLTKTVYATLLALAVGVARVPFPFYPRHLTVVSTLTIGVPAFFLALAPNPRRARPGFVGRVLRFAAPAGVIAAVATFAAYALTRGHSSVDLREARTTATVVLFSVGLWVLAILARPATAARRLLVGCMGGAFLAVLTIPALRRFFELDPPSPGVTLWAVVVAVVAALALEGGWRLTGWRRNRSGGNIPLGGKVGAPEPNGRIGT
jgi:cation-transporting P-type ATPase E